MDPMKAAFLQMALDQGKSVNQDNFLPFLLAMQKHANERGITFTEEETNLIYNQLQGRLSPSERKQLELLRTMMQQKNGK